MTRPSRRGAARRMRFAMRRHWMDQEVRTATNPKNQRVTSTAGHVKRGCVDAGCGATGCPGRMCL